MTNQDFATWFSSTSSDIAPWPWQSRLVQSESCRNRLIRVPTGLGKTLGVLAAWAYHRLIRHDDAWPRRLVWCLPMRTLVEQTEQVARQLVERLEVADQLRPHVSMLMGGEEAGDWFLYPERPAVLIGTQDMLLSRALNRGYAAGRSRWPIDFGLLNHDALWVMDEVQLMDVGLATSAQLQAFREQDRAKHLRPTYTWWMSATLQPRWLHSADTDAFFEDWTNDPCQIPIEEQTGGLWEISKGCRTTAVDAKKPAALAQLVVQEHQALSDGPNGRITLVVCNTVDRACETFDAIRKAGWKGELELVHSRFRPVERESWRERFLSRRACASGADRIIVATQVVEAGVDISAACLVTELAPWSSLVQRFGRCARYGGSGRVVVVDRRKNEEDTAPYLPQELAAAWQAVQTLSDVGIRSLEEFERNLDEPTLRSLYPYEPEHLLLRGEFDDLFDTTPDLTGADLDISRFIRSGEERDVQMFWLEVPPERKGEPLPLPPEDYRPQRRELCAVPFLTARDWLCEKGKSQLKSSKRAWVWDWIEGQWQRATREAILPGRIVCVAADSGGYRLDRGFDVSSTAAVSPVHPEEVEAAVVLSDLADNAQENEALSGAAWKTIATHADEVVAEAEQIADHLKLSEELKQSLRLAARWHDWGKSHPAFQGSIRGSGTVTRPDRQDLAKAPEPCWPKRYRYRFSIAPAHGGNGIVPVQNGGKPDSDRTSVMPREEHRPGFRHELASAMGLFSLLRMFEPEHEALLGPLAGILATSPDFVTSFHGYDAVHNEMSVNFRHASGAGGSQTTSGTAAVLARPASPSPCIDQLLRCNREQFDLVAYLVASHHGKVRVGLHASVEDQDYRDRDGRGLPIRGVRHGDRLPETLLEPNTSPVPEVALTLAPASLGLSPTTGASWTERCLELQERFGPCALGYLECLLRAADIRASRLETEDYLLQRKN